LASPRAARIAVHVPGDARGVDEVEQRTGERAATVAERLVVRGDLLELGLIARDCRHLLHRDVPVAQHRVAACDPARVEAHHVEPAVHLRRQHPAQLDQLHTGAAGAAGIDQN
jgi:hypothetical protein